MSYDFTVPQSGDDERQARELSLRHTRPPTQVPGYDLTRFLGSGAYGEVWIGLDRNTGRQVAVKFYQHRGGVDWALLSREVEKLVLLSTDRYVVQLLDVGWQADPPFYVMEYIENGSLEQLIQKNEGRTVDQTVELFREIVVGLNHAHAKGILHCDLKPANVLLDQDAKPRLADFGQSRLTNEQTPSLGTLFYMAPEQADLKAVPDARWDVYASGAILYCMLVGKPPHMNDELLRRIEAATDLPSRLKIVPPVDRRQEATRRASQGAGGGSRTGLYRGPLSGRPILQTVCQRAGSARCAAPRDHARARRPLLLLGVLGPAAAAGRDGLRWLHRLPECAGVVGQGGDGEGLREQCVCSAVRRGQRGDGHRAVLSRRRARGTRTRNCGSALPRRREQLQPLLARLADPQLPEDELQRLCAEFEQRPGAPETAAESHRADGRPQPAGGRQLVRVRRARDAPGRRIQTGDDVDHRRQFRQPDVLLRRAARHRGPAGAPHAGPARASARASRRRFFSRATKRWKIAVSTPLYRSDDADTAAGRPGAHPRRRRLHDVPARRRAQFAVLVDGRDNGYQGMLLDHPWLTKSYSEGRG